MDGLKSLRENYTLSGPYGVCVIAQTPCGTQSGVTQGMGFSHCASQLNLRTMETTLQNGLGQDVSIHRLQHIRLSCVGPQA
jgi:hypothetical protein